MAKIKITEKPLVQNPPEDYNLLVSYDIDDVESLRRIPVSALKGDLNERLDGLEQDSSDILDLLEAVRNALINEDPGEAINLIDTFLLDHGRLAPYNGGES